MLLLPLRYLIGANSVEGFEKFVTCVPYDVGLPKIGTSIGYCNLFDEKNTGKLGPYLRTSSTAKQYKEGQIDPRGSGWNKNLVEQFTRRAKQGFEYIELDNADAYAIEDILAAIGLAQAFCLKVIAKNPGLLRLDAKRYVTHPNIYGIIVEHGAGSPKSMDLLRKSASNPDIPVWFVSYGKKQMPWIKSTALAALDYKSMWASYSDRGEYKSSIQVAGRFQ